MTPISIRIGSSVAANERVSPQKKRAEIEQIKRCEIRIRMNFVSICVLNGFNLLNCRHSVVRMLETGVHKYVCAANVTKEYQRDFDFKRKTGIGIIDVEPMDRSECATDSSSSYR